LRDAVLYAIALTHDTPRQQSKKGGKNTGGNGGNGNIASVVGVGVGGGNGNGSGSSGEGVLVEECSCAEGLAALHAHVSALGQFGDTAFLSCMYGSGEVAQAFCRLCAVSRGTYVLRHALHAVVVETQEEEESREEKGETGGGGGDETEGASSDDVAQALSTGPGERVVGICDSQGHFIACDKFVCAADYLLPTSAKPPVASSEEPRGGCELRPCHAMTWTVRRVCIVDGPVVLSAERAVVVIKPDSGDVDSGAIGNLGPIHAIVADESTMVAPRNLGASVVHLTMTAHFPLHRSTADEDDNDDNDPLTNMLAEAGETLKRAIDTLCEGQGVREVWHLSCALPVTSPTGGAEKGAAGAAEALLAPSVSSQQHNETAGWEVAHRLRYSLDPDPVVRQAKAIFESLFGTDVPFLTQNEEERMEAMRARGEVEGTGDEDEDALSAALDAADRGEKAEEEKRLRLAELQVSLEARVLALEQGDAIVESKIRALEARVVSGY
jgi:hypothetical protein